MKQGIGGCLVILAACIGASSALNGSAFEQIGDLPHGNFSTGYWSYVNGSLYNFQGKTLDEFDVATKQWEPNRNYTSIQRPGFFTRYFALVNRIFAILTPYNLSVDSNPLFLFWDKDAGQFQSLSVYVDPNSMPSSTLTSTIYWAFGVPDKAGSDAYFALTSIGSSASDVAFSKFHVEFKGSVPINGEMRGLHRASLPVNITVEYLVLRENALFWFLKTYTSDMQDSVLDTDHVHYYNLISNSTGNISTASNNGTYLAPSFATSYIIGDNHVLTFGRIDQESPWKSKYFVMWLFDFGSAQWTASIVNHAGYIGLHMETVDMVNRLVYQMTPAGVYEAKIDV